MNIKRPIRNLALIIPMITLAGAVFFLITLNLDFFQIFTLSDYSRQSEKLLQTEQWLKTEHADYSQWLTIETAYNHFRSKSMGPFAKFPEFRDTMAAAIGENDVELVGFKHLYQKSLFETKGVKIMISVKGYYPALKKMIMAIENMPQLILFNELHMRLSDTGKIQTDIVMEVYFAD
jgi:hypothetical protein